MRFQLVIEIDQDFAEGYLEIELYSSPEGGARLEEVLRLLGKEGYNFRLKAILRKKLRILE